MTNTFDGNIVLGIDEVKDVSGHLIKFKKTGFANNNEDNVRNAVNNALVSVEPRTKVRVHNLLNTNSKFYTISKVEDENSTKELLESLHNQCN
jgi:hypothetical protein